MANTLDRVMFMGSPDFAVPALESVAALDVDLWVVTQPDKPTGRGQKTRPTPVKSRAIALQKPVYTPADKQAVADLVNEAKPDLIVVVAYGMIIPKSITDTYFCVNIHPSLLPQYRGPSPIQASLLNRDTESGISLIRLNEKMDAGPILSQIKQPLLDTDTYGMLHDQFAQKGADLLVDWIKNQFLPGTVQETSQDEHLATYCGMLKTEDREIKAGMSIAEILGRVRAFSPRPGAYIIRPDGKRVKLLDLEVQSGRIQLTRVQPEGKPEMAYSDYILGHPEGLL